MMTRLQKLAWKKRDDQPYAKIREIFTKTFDSMLRSWVADGGQEFIKVLWTALLDNAAVYAQQVGITKEAFVLWAAESFDMYEAFIKEANGNQEQAHALSARLRKEMR